MRQDSPYSLFLKELKWEDACIGGTRDGVRTCPQTSQKVRNLDLKPGDLLLIVSQDDRIEHAGIYLADDLFFERAGVRSGLLYRINTWAEIAKVYSPGVKTTAVFRRFNQENLKPLPNPTEVFGNNSREEKDVEVFIPEVFRTKLKAIYQPEVGDQRDIAIYPYTDISILPNPDESNVSNPTESKTHYILAPESKDKSHFTSIFD